MVVPCHVQNFGAIWQPGKVMVKRDFVRFEFKMNCGEVAYIDSSLESWRVNLLWPSHATRRQKSWSTLVYVMACCRTAPSHHLTNINLSSTRSSGILFSETFTWTLNPLIPMFLIFSHLPPTPTLIVAWISNRVLKKVWDEINYPFPNFNGSPLKFVNG